MFTQPARVDISAMSETAKKLFGAGDFAGGTTFLRHRASEKLDLPTERLDAIVEALGARPHALRESEVFVPASQVARAKKDGYFENMQDVQDQENAEWWAEEGERISREYEEARRGWDKIDFPTSTSPTSRSDARAESDAAARGSDLGAPDYPNAALRWSEAAYLLRRTFDRSGMLSFALSAVRSARYRLPSGVDLSGKGSLRGRDILALAFTA